MPSESISHSASRLKLQACGFSERPIPLDIYWFIRAVPPRDRHVSPLPTIVRKNARGMCSLSEHFISFSVRRRQAAKTSSSDPEILCPSALSFVFFFSISFLFSATPTNHTSRLEPQQTGASLEPLFRCVPCRSKKKSRLQCLSRDSTINLIIKNHSSTPLYSTSNRMLHLPSIPAATTDSGRSKRRNFRVEKVAEQRLGSAFVCCFHEPFLLSSAYIIFGH